MDSLNQPIVIDNGSGTLKAGFAGSDSPTVRLFRSFVVCFVELNSWTQCYFPSYVGGHDPISYTYGG